MNDRDSVHPIGQSQARPRARAKAKITVRSSEVEPYDQTASPALVRPLDRAFALLDPLLARPALAS